MQPAILLEIIEEAIWAPTGDNMQAWRFIVKDNSLVVQIDKEKAYHPIDPHYHAMMISLGGLLEYISISSKVRGYNMSYEFEDDNCMSVELTFKETTDRQHNLYSQLRKRATDRRKYKTKDIPLEVLSKIIDTNNFYHSKVSFYKPEKKSSLWSYLKKSDFQFWNISELIYATFQWIDFTNNIPKKGLNWRNLGMNKLDVLMTRLMFASKKIYDFLLKLGVAKVLSKKTSDVYKKTPGFLLFSVKESSNSSLVEVGRQAIHCWLTLAKHGIVAQPLTLSSLCIFDESANTKTKVHEEAKDLFKNGNDLFSNLFRLEENDTATWLLRIGFPLSEMAENMKSQRVDSLTLLANEPTDQVAHAELAVSEENTEKHFQE